MKNTWVLSIRTSLPEVCESHGDLQTSIYTFDSFEEARTALRKVLKKYAFSENSMFDGKGNIIYFHKYITDLAYDDDMDEYGDFLSPKSSGLWKERSKTFSRAMISFRKSRKVFTPII